MNYKEELKKLAFGYSADDIVASYTKDGKLLIVRKYQRKIPGNITAALEYKRIYGDKD